MPPRLLPPSNYPSIDALVEAANQFLAAPATVSNPCPDPQALLAASRQFATLAVRNSDPTDLKKALRCIAMYPNSRDQCATVAFAIIRDAAARLSCPLESLLTSGTDPQACAVEEAITAFWPNPAPLADFGIYIPSGEFSYQIRRT